MAREHGEGISRTDVAQQGNPTPLTLSGATQALAAANKNRVALVITAPAAAVSLSLGAAAAVAGQGLTIPPASIYTLREYTGAVQIIGTAAQVVSFVEI